MSSNPFLSCSLGDFSSERKLLNTAFHSDGIFQHRKNLLGNFYYQVDKTSFANYGISTTGKIAFERDEDSLPKIPITLLLEIIRIYREVSKTIKSEVFIAIVWDKVKEDYFLHVPVQTVNAASIDYEKTDSIYNNTDYFVVMDTHSHVNMSAFFSGTDLADETSTRFFGVIGKIDSEVPEMIVRAASVGKTIPLEIEDIFDYDVLKLKDDSNYILDDSIFDNITEEIITYASTYGTRRNNTAVVYADDYMDDFGYSYGGTYKNSTHNSYSKKKKYSDTLTYQANPFSKIYTAISSMRYSTVFKEETATNFLDIAFECVKLYYKDHEKSAADLDDLYITYASELATFDYNDYDQKQPPLLQTGL